ncbi:MAG: hypothetical protein ACREDO_00840, partial [Methyloceanibacter sp.]
IDSPLASARPGLDFELREARRRCYILGSTFRHRMQGSLKAEMTSIPAVSASAPAWEPPNHLLPLAQGFGYGSAHSPYVHDVIQSALGRGRGGPS